MVTESQRGRHFPRRPNPWTLATGILGCAGLFLVLSTFPHYGITYDEKWNSTYGYYVLRWYASAFTEQNALNYWTLPCEGAFFNVLVRAIDRVLGLGPYETGHLVGALFGALGVLFACRLARRLGGPAAGFFAMLFLTTLPIYYGHAFSNPRDIPMAALAMTALHYLVSVFDRLPRPPSGLLLKLGVAIGLALAVRVGSVILIGLTGLAFLLWFALHCREGRAGTGDPPRRWAEVLALAKNLGLLVLISWAAMLPWWPKAQVRPLWPIEAFLYTTQEFAYDIKVLFEGRVLSNQDLPWSYVLKWMALVTPEHFFAALAVGLLAAVPGVRELCRQPGALAGPVLARFILVAALPVLPVAYAVIHGAVVYDGIRHFLFIFPPLSVLAGWSIAAALRRFRNLLARLVILAAVLVPAVLTAIDMVRLHPYQYIFFNRSVAGGLPGAAGRYDTEYWGSSYKEGVAWIVANYHCAFPDRKIRVVSNSYSLSTSHYLPADRFEYLGSLDSGQPVPASAPRPDLFLSTLRWDGHQKIPGRVIHTVERMGVPLLHVIEVDAR